MMMMMIIAKMVKYT